MNRFYKKYRSLGNGVNIILLISVLVPLLALSYYNQPSPADDYCYIDTVFKFGWLEAMNYYYSGWTGRYFGIFLNHTNPLILHWVNGFKVLPVILLSGLIYALYTLFRHLTPTLSRIAHLGFAGVVFFLYILQIGSIAEAFYWMAAFVTYTIPNILTLLWIVLVLRWYRQDTQPGRILFGTMSGFLIFAVIGSSETNLLVMILLIAAWWVYRILFHKKVDGFMITMLIIAAGSCYLFFSSPGNAARIGGNPLSGNLVFSVTSSFKKLAELSKNWFLQTPLLLFSFAWLAVLTRLSTGSRNYFSVPVWFAVLLFIGVLSAQLFPSYYGVGIDPTLRVINCVYFFFLIGWFYIIGVVYHYFRHLNFSKAPFQLSLTKYTILYLVLFLTIGYSFYKSANVRVIYTDLLKGKAAAFNRQNKERYALINDSKDSVVYLPPIYTQPVSLFVEDIKPNKDHWWNKCMAGYFGKEAIYLKEEHSGQK
ncbi:DUF6056 family protein [Dyadobacter sp. NIV53]|uniref:DUF6056 family protein n=1 Tax=Dyadobacter sp. NIV53 TaxID=2861765 RepID=UPI001C867BD9|nr:DUF6056 family protein [Dyadobacter sp. NIV53]